MKRVLVISCLILLALACVLSVPNTAYAADIIASGECGADGNNLTWTLDSSGVLTISGEGAMADDDDDSWSSYRESIKSVVISDGVTNVAPGSFFLCNQLKTVILSDSVISIGKTAFMYSGLESITFGNNVTSIGSNAFYYCQNLKSITIPSSVTTIGKSAFGECNSLHDVYYDRYLSDWDSITIESDNKSLNNAISHYTDGVMGKFGSNGDNLIWVLNNNGMLSISGEGEMGLSSRAPWMPYNSSINAVVLEEGITDIGQNAFAGCTAMTSITIPNGVQQIGSSAFEGCTAMTSITIPNSVQQIGYSVFRSCDNLKDVYYNGDNRAWISITIGENNASLYAATFHFSGKSNMQLGDVTGDGEVTANDLTSLSRHIARIEQLNDSNLNVADVNKDSKIDADDLTTLSRFVARIITDFDDEITHTHSYLDTIIEEPTCAKDGIRMYICSCGDKYNETIPSVDHKMINNNGVCLYCSTVVCDISYESSGKVKTYDNNVLTIAYISSQKVLNSNGLMDVTIKYQAKTTYISTDSRDKKPTIFFKVYLKEITHTDSGYHYETIDSRSSYHQGGQGSSEYGSVTFYNIKPGKYTVSYGE